MLPPKSLEHYGRIKCAKHQGDDVLVWWQLDRLKVFSVDDFKEMGSVLFKQSIRLVKFPICVKMDDLSLLVVTDDGFVHNLLFTNGNFSILSSTNVGKEFLEESCALCDKSGDLYLLFSNGVVYNISKQPKDPQKIQIPQFNDKYVFCMIPVEDFEHQKDIHPNSSSFISTYSNESEMHLGSFIFDFAIGKVIEGPYSIRLASDAVLYGNNAFIQFESVYSISPFKKLDLPESFGNIVCGSSSKSICLADSKMQILRFNHSRPQIIKTEHAISQVECTPQHTITLSYDGLLISVETNRSVQIQGPKKLLEYNSIFIPVSCDGIQPFSLNTGGDVKTRLPEISGKKAVLLSSAVYTMDYDILYSSVYIHSTGVFYAFASAATYSIVFEDNTTKSVKKIAVGETYLPITAIAVSNTKYAVATTDCKVVVLSHTAPAYNFTFQSTLCTSLSLSDTTIAIGYADGTFVLASIEQKGPILNIRPFKTQIVSVKHLSSTSTLVEWHSVSAVISPEEISWTRLPSYPGAKCATYTNGVLALGNDHSLDLYNYSTHTLLARVERRIVDVCSSGRRFFALTDKHELIVLYYHRDIHVDHQTIIDVIDPMSIAVVDETVYVLCMRDISVFDVRGHRIDTINIVSTPILFESVSNGVYVVFRRMVWFLSRDQSMKKIPCEKANIVHFTAINNDRFCISTSNRVMLCDTLSNKVSFTTILKISKFTKFLKAFSSRGEETADSLLVIFDDDEQVVLPIQPPKPSKFTSDTANLSAPDFPL